MLKRASLLRTPIHNPACGRRSNGSQPYEYFQCEQYRNDLDNTLGIYTRQENSSGHGIAGRWCCTSRRDLSFVETNQMGLSSVEARY